MAVITLPRLAIVSAALGAWLYTVVQSGFELQGKGREVVPLNNERCRAVPGLEACEDAWIDDRAGKAYLVCSDRPSRAAWVPAMLHLNATALPAVSADYIAVLDLSTLSYYRLALKGLPAEAGGIWVHGLDVFRDPLDAKKLTIFLNSHRPPKDRSSAPLVGADSVVEILEHRSGSGEANWIKTVQHQAVRTPNNLVAMGARTFFVSNDHAHKAHWTRRYELLWPIPSDIVYCDASSALPACKVAASKVIYPNGIAKGPGNLLYSGSTLGGFVQVWEIQSDFSLSPLQRVPIKRPIDNIHVATDGSIFVTTLAKVLDFIAAGKDGGMSGKTAAVEAWRVTNATDAAEPRNRKYKAELAFADTGEIVSASTTAAPYKNQLLLTGIFSKEVVLCVLE
ncbi:hypothetical protein JCM10213_009152 [Rhodosporidiobolus nylandii]